MNSVGKQTFETKEALEYQNAQLKAKFARFGESTRRAIEHLRVVKNYAEKDINTWFKQASYWQDKYYKLDKKHDWAQFIILVQSVTLLVIGILGIVDYLNK